MSNIIIMIIVDILMLGNTVIMTVDILVGEMLVVAAILAAAAISVVEIIRTSDIDRKLFALLTI